MVAVVGGQAGRPAGNIIAIPVAALVVVAVVVLVRDVSLFVIVDAWL